MCYVDFHDFNYAKRLVATHLSDDMSTIRNAWYGYEHSNAGRYENNAQNVWTFVVCQNYTATFQIDTGPMFYFTERENLKASLVRLRSTFEKVVRPTAS